MKILQLIVKLAIPQKPIESYRRYMFFGPHPDDIEIGAGATIAKLSKLKKEICFVIVTDGRFGFTSATKGMSEDELVEVRKREAIESAKVLGVSDVRFLALPDGDGYTKAELLKAMATSVGEFKPDIVFAPDPMVPSECHQDHINVGNAARETACFAPYEGIMKTFGAESAPVDAIAYYMSRNVNMRVRSRGGMRKQLDAIFTCH